MTPNPGVYKMLDANNNVIYVGKAKNLKKRVSSYFQQKNHSTRIKRKISLIKKIDLTIIASGSEVNLAIETGHKLAKYKIYSKIISMPSQEIFELQSKSYKE